jgi:hypothetical protein
MSQMGSHDPIEYLKHNLWPKEEPLKVRNRLNLDSCRWRTTYHWKVLNEGYNVSSNLTTIGGPHKKLWASKVMRVLILRILELPT